MNLLVPIDVRALVATEDAGAQTWAELTPRYALLDDGITLGDQLAPAPFTPRPAGPEPGVHLHWAMPDALTHGRQDEHGSTQYPPLPNRWLVVRLWTDRRGELRTRAWVVVSDALSDTDPGGSTPWPLRNDDGTYRSAFLGRVVDAADWTEPGGEPWLTAVGPGDPLFAASYWSCRNVFTLHDRLEDVTAGAEPMHLSYLVVGWWSDPACDPLAGRPDWWARVHELGWSLPQGVVDAPGDTLLHGLVHGVRWAGPRGAGPTGVPQGPVQVALGNSTTEALAALLAAHLPDHDNAERLIQAFLDGLLPQLEGPDGLMVLEELMHEGEFAPADGGAHWDVVPAGTLTTRRPVKAALTPLPAELADPLDALNALQRAAELGRQELDGARALLYGTWHKQAQLAQSAWPGSLSATQVATFITDVLLPRIGQLEQDVVGLERDRDTARTAAQAAVDADADHELVELPRGRFWQPRPPVAVLSGPGVERSYRHGFDGRHAADGTLRCRVSGMPLPGPAIELAHAPERLGADAADLVAEAAALSPALSAGGDPDGGVAPSPAGVVRWAPPWTPLTLQWEAQWRPTADTPAGALRGWELGELDFHWTGGDPFRAPARRYSGQAPLDPATTVRLSARITRYLADHPDDPLRDRLAALAASVADLNVVSQSLSGFVWQLLGTLQTLQLPVLDPGDPALGKAVAAHVREAEEIAPDPSGDYAPLRAGNLLVTRLALVDTFGQVKPVGIEAGAPPPIVSAALRSPVEPRYAELPPRIAQPARLRFEWRPAADGAIHREATSDAATTPVAGWVLPNPTDLSLMLYDPFGGLLGELQLIDGALDPAGPGVRWLAAAGTPQIVGAPPALPNATLQGFVGGLMRAGARGHHALRDLMACADDALAGVDALGAWKDQSLSILVGRPLALARAAVWLELDGPPAGAQTWEGLTYLLEHGALPTAGFTSVRLPVVLGDTRRLADGLIGFFRGADFDRFQLARDGAAPHGGYVVPSEPVHVTADPAGEPVELTLLLDPRGAVHASCAFLPAGSLSLSADFCAAAQAAMDVTFLTGPVVTDPARVSLPLPATAGRWEWLAVDGAGAWQREDRIAPVDVRASLDGGPQAILDGWLKLSDALGEDR
jgi:hypothetical protein